MRCAVVLGEGKYVDEFGGYRRQEGPRTEFIEIANLLNADVLSYTSAAANRGWPFRILFGRQTKIGSAVNAAMIASRYDRIYVTSDGVGVPLAVLLKMRGWRGKITCVVHNMTWEPKKSILSLLGHDIFSAFITVSEMQAQILRDTCRIPASKVRSVFNWVDDEYFSPTVQPPELAEPYIMACGAENRDYECLARASSLISGRFRVFGHGFRASNIQAQSSGSNLEYMPHVPFSKLKEFYAAASIVVVPLNDVTYAAGVTGLVEAMAAGKPVIVTNSAGISDYTAFMDRATVVPAADPEAMANAIRRLQQDSRLRQELGAANRKFAVERCAVDKYARMVQECMLGGD